MEKFEWRWFFYPASQENLMTWAVPSLLAAKISEDVIDAEFWAEKAKCRSQTN